MQRAFADPPVTELEALEAELAFDPRDLEGAVAVQPDLYYRTAKAVASTTADRDYAKLEMQEIEARILLEIKADPSVKMTVAEAEAHVTLHEEVQAARRAHIMAVENANEAQGLREAYLQRGYAIRELALMSNMGQTVIDRDLAATAYREDLVARRNAQGA